MSDLNLYMMTTTSCNLRCPDCYVSDFTTKRMSESTLDAAMEFVEQSEFEKINFLWYGGEPTLRTQPFFEAAIKKQERLSKAYTNLIQTNLFRTENSLLEWLVKNNFTISTSIDGWKEIHDVYRVARDGSGTYDQVMQNIERVKELGGKLWAISVLHEQNTVDARRLFDVFNDASINVRFCPAIPTDHNQILHSDVVYDAFAEIYDASQEDASRIKVSNFRKWATALQTSKPQECDYLKTCIDHNLCIDTNADIYPCNRCVGNDEFKLGALNEDGSVIWNDEVIENIRNRIYDNSHLSNPELLHGGCMFSAYAQTGTIDSIDSTIEAVDRMLEYMKGESDDTY